MSILHTLRQPSGIARWVLVWFALYLGVAVAAPWVRPQAMTLACGATGGLKLVLLDSSTASASSAADTPAGPNATPDEPRAGHTLDCPLCMTASAPPPLLVAYQPLSPDCPHALLPLEVARLATLIDGPGQARAPPAL